MIQRSLNVPVRWDREPKKRKQPEPAQPQQGLVHMLRSQAPLTWEIELEGHGSQKKKSKRSTLRKAKAAKDQQQTLRSNSAGQVTQKKYKKHWGLLVAWSRGRVRVDMPLYLEHLYFASYTVAATVYMIPGTKGSGNLPLAQQSMKGWRRLCPPRARMPVPYETVCLLAMKAFNTGNAQICLFLLLSFLLYLRPGEALKIRVQDIVSPVKRAGRAYQHYAILLHPTEEGIPSKTSAVGRDAKFGFEALQVFGTSPYFLAEHQVPAQERACVQCEPARCDRLLSRSLEQPRTRPPGQIPPISPPSWRGIP